MITVRIDRGYTVMVTEDEEVNVVIKRLMCEKEIAQYKCIQKTNAGTLLRKPDVIAVLILKKYKEVRAYELYQGDKLYVGWDKVEI